MKPPSKAALQELTPRGMLRAAINFGNPVLAQKHSDSGDPCGVSVDLARELTKAPERSARVRFVRRSRKSV